MLEPAPPALFSSSSASELEAEGHSTDVSGERQERRLRRTAARSDREQLADRALRALERLND